MEYVLFPAHAGVILVTAALNSKAGTFPRTRGGDPTEIESLPVQILFSPHTRG